MEEEYRRQKIRNYKKTMRKTVSILSDPQRAGGDRAFVVVFYPKIFLAASL
jgi:hypothetical protein